MRKEDIYFTLIESFLSEFVGKGPNYMPVQLMVLFLAAKSPDINTLGLQNIKTISQTYPTAVEQTLGGPDALDTITIPPVDKMRGKIPEVWNSLSTPDKDKIMNIYNFIMQNMQKA